MIEGVVTILLSITIAAVFVFIYLFFIKKDLIVWLPKNVSMSANAFPAFIKALNKVLDSRYKQIYFDFSRVVDIDYEGYLVILALSERVFYKGKELKPCNIPLNKKIQNVLFKNNKNRKVYHQSDPFPPLKADLYYKDDQNTPDVTYRVENELKKIDIRDYYEFNTMVSELVGNAIEHGIRHRAINWWMYHCKDYNTRSIKFVFVDMGIGIVDSYRKAGLPREHQKKSDDEILLLALNGVLGSSTKEPNRGRGLPQIRDMVEKNYISDFVLITNTVSLRYENGRFEQMLHQNFVGTYYSWTISKENFNLWQNRI